MKKFFVDTMNAVVENSTGAVIIAIIAPVFGLLAKLTFSTYLYVTGLFLVVSGIWLLVKWTGWLMATWEETPTDYFKQIARVWLTYVFTSIGAWVALTGRGMMSTEPVATTITSIAFFSTVAAIVAPFIARLTTSLAKRWINR